MGGDALDGSQEELRACADDRLGLAPGLCAGRRIDGPAFVLTFRSPLGSAQGTAFPAAAVFPAGVVSQHRRHVDRRRDGLGRCHGAVIESYCVLAPKKLVEFVDRA